MDVEQIERIERACERLSIAYARAVDFRDYDTFASLFSHDGVLDIGQPITGGPTAILRSVSKRPDELRSRHVLTNIFIDVLDADTARGISYLSLYRHNSEKSLAAGPVPLTGPAAIGHYEDRFVREAGQWRIASRKLYFAFQNPDHF